MTTETYLPEVLPARDLFLKMRFRASQIDAMRQLYNKWFKPFIDSDFQYVGNGISIFWNNGANTEGRKYVDPFNCHGYNLEEVTADPLWNEFEDILPYMGQTGTITYLPPFSVMTPHIDRNIRPVPIYFPISGCSTNCVSDFYNLPKSTDPTAYHSSIEPAIPVYSYAITDNAVLMNQHEWHGVRNHTRQTRIAFGWNTAGGPNKKSYAQLRDIFTELGYIDEQ
jgi:hypothetical protein